MRKMVGPRADPSEGAKGDDGEGEAGRGYLPKVPRGSPDWRAGAVVASPGMWQIRELVRLQQLVTAGGEDEPAELDGAGVGQSEALLTFEHAVELI